MFCNNCGTQLPDGSKFCQNCGAGQAPAVAPNNDFISSTPKTELAFDAPVAEIVPPAEPPVAPQPGFTPPVQPPVAPQPEFAAPVQPPVAPQPNFMPPVQPPVAPITPPAPKKKNTGIIIAAIVAILVVAGIIVGVVLAGNGSSNDDEDDKKDETTSSQVSSKSADDDEDYITDDKEDEVETTKPLTPPSSGISRGTVNGNVYRNNYANITFTKHSDWLYFSDSELADLIGSASTSVGYDIETALEQTGSFYDMGSSTPYGSPNVIIGFENLAKTNSTNATEEQYLAAVSSMLTGYNCGSSYKASLGSETYTVMDASVVSNGVEVYQRYYVRKIDNYVVFIIMTATAENSFVTLENMFS